ncbi:MAG: lysophospholipid acyltransferase family protein [Actinomycetia bacterium]|nr:lysophospholipid acyltransferase family protein [Actinomycetes bacterium]
MLYTLFKYLLFRPVCRYGFRPTVEGEENIPARGGAVLAANHTSAGETFLLPAMIRRRMTFPAKAELFTGHDLPSHVVAWFLKAVGQVPMDRSGGRASAMGLEPVMEVLRAGGLVGIFPEGTRSRDGRLHRGRTGVARLALSAQVPVVPVGFYGTEFRKGPLGVPTMHRPVIRIGRPITLDAYQGIEPDGSVYRRLTDQVMREIQKLTGQEYVDAYAGTARAARTAAGGQPGVPAEPAPGEPPAEPAG